MNEARAPRSVRCDPSSVIRKNGRLEPIEDAGVGDAEHAAGQIFIWWARRAHA